MNSIKCAIGAQSDKSHAESIYHAGEIIHSEDYVFDQLVSTKSNDWKLHNLHENLYLTKEEYENRPKGSKGICFEYFIKWWSERMWMSGGLVDLSYMGKKNTKVFDYNRMSWFLQNILHVRLLEDGTFIQYNKSWNRRTVSGISKLLMREMGSLYSYKCEKHFRYKVTPFRKVFDASPWSDGTFTIRWSDDQWKSKLTPQTIKPGIKTKCFIHKDGMDYKLSNQSVKEEIDLSFEDWSMVSVTEKLVRSALQTPDKFIPLKEIHDEYMKLLVSKKTTQQTTSLFQYYCNRMNINCDGEKKRGKRGLILSKVNHIMV